MAEIHKAKLVELSDAKLVDARLLLASGRAGNAYYLAGYAVELMLKAILSSRFRDDTLPDRMLSKDVFVHDLAKLSRLANLDEDLKRHQDIDDSFNGNWRTALNWDESSRYVDQHLDEAKELIEAIDDPHHGVLQWLRSKL